jgi:hypothetical protein
MHELLSRDISRFICQWRGMIGLLASEVEAKDKPERS